jgi:acyl-coenzyme A thioesterase PaaI-like protein
MSELYDLYKRLGNADYGQAIGRIAPYFATIDPQFVALEPGYCEIVLRYTRAVQNHLGGIHAIAICNAAELVAGLATDVSIPARHRWIPVAMQVEYLAQARTDLHVSAHGRALDWSVLGRIAMPVQAVAIGGQKVLTGEITMQIAEKKV